MSNDSLILMLIRELRKKGRFAMEKHFLQHGTTTVYEHSIRVACLSDRIASHLPLRLNHRSLLRGALLHDYFLYDWHIPGSGEGLHGFTHPQIALQNAEQDYVLNDVERDIISHHMFPLTLLHPPRTREGFIVCIADKLCALHESLNRFHLSFS